MTFHLLFTWASAVLLLFPKTWHEKYAVYHTRISLPVCRLVTKRYGSLEVVYNVFFPVSFNVRRTASPRRLFVFEPKKTAPRCGSRRIHRRSGSCKKASFFSFETDPKHVDTCCGETMHVRTGMIDWRLVRKTVARHASTCGGYIALCVHPVLEHCFQLALVASKGCNKKTSLRVTCGHQSEDSWVTASDLHCRLKWTISDNARFSR